MSVEGSTGASGHSSLGAHPSTVSRLRVSVALCIHNGGTYLDEQLDSLAAQSRLPDELVVGDDRASDDALELLRRFGQRTGIPVRVQRNDPPLLMNANFEKTMGRCGGDVIMPCDRDDRWRPDKVERQVSLFESDPSISFVLGTSLVCDSEMKPTGRTVFEQHRFSEPYKSLVRSGDGFQAFLRHNVAPGHALAFSARALRMLLPIATTCVYDQWISVIACAVGRSALIDGVVVDYRTHDSQMVGAENKSLLDQAGGLNKLKLDHRQRHLETAKLLRERVKQFASMVPSYSDRMALIEDRVRFCEARVAMRGNAARRLARATGMLLRGDYSRHARGMLSFARDVKGNA